MVPSARSQGRRPSKLPFKPRCVSRRAECHVGIKLLVHMALAHRTLSWTVFRDPRIGWCNGPRRMGFSSGGMRFRDGRNMHIGKLQFEPFALGCGGQVLATPYGIHACRQCYIWLMYCMASLRCVQHLCHAKLCLQPFTVPRGAKGIVHWHIPQLAKAGHVRRRRWARRRCRWAFPWEAAELRTEPTSMLFRPCHA